MVSNPDDQPVTIVFDHVLFLQDELITAIHLDIKNAKEALDREESRAFANHDHFKPEVKNKL